MSADAGVPRRMVRFTDLVQLERVSSYERVPACRIQERLICTRR